MKRWLCLCVATVSVLVVSAVHASFHTFRIEQLYSNADGTVQFIVMHEASGANGENLWAGQALTSAIAGSSRVYVFPDNLPGGDGGYYAAPSPTANKRVLIATQGFAALGLVPPDYLIPSGFLATGGGTLTYAGVDQVPYAVLPADGVTAIDRNGAMIPNRATNFAGMSASVSAPAPVINYEGVWWTAPGGSESGWGLTVTHQGDAIFLGWFTYDATGKAWWLSLTATKTAANTYSGTLIQSSGPAFSAVPFDPAKVTRTPVGTGTLTFGDAGNGSFAYTVNTPAGPVTQVKPITRVVFAAVPTCTYGAQPDFVHATNYQDVWWVTGGAESGWGLVVTHQGDTIFAGWFTYDTDGTPLWLSATAPNTAPGVYAGALIRTNGPPFSAVPWDPSKVTRTTVGALTLTFIDGNTATFAYTVNGVTQTKTLTRVLFVPPAGTACR